MTGRGFRCIKRQISHASDHLHPRMNKRTGCSRSRHLYASRSSLTARLDWKVIHFTNPYLLHPPSTTNGVTDCWPPSGGRQRVVLKRFTWAHARNAALEASWCMSSHLFSWLRSHSDSLTTLSRSERICRPHRVVKSAVSFVSPTISSVSPSGMWKASRCVSLCKMESSASCL